MGDDASVGVYLHVPFCERVCPYCDFAVVAARPLGVDLERAYVGALETELATRWDVFAGRRLASVYFGGGTPSLLRPESVARLLERVRATFEPAPALEVTLEANPSTLERGRLGSFRDAGVTRLSVGVQSFDDSVLKRLGRAHRAEVGRTTLAAARAAGFENLSVDLIFAVPGQTLESLCRDLDELVAFGPEHVSAYQLTVEPDTPYATAVARGTLVLPEDDLAAAMYETVAEAFEAAGLARYEISSFAIPGRESRHNQRYWQRRPVLGLGVGAWSSEPPDADAPFGARHANRRDLGGYLEAVRRGAATVPGPRERLGAATARGEAVFLALRTCAGLSGPDFAKEFGGLPRRFFGEEIGELCAAGLLEETPAGDLRLTRRGVLLSDSVFACFVEPEAEASPASAASR